LEYNREAQEAEEAQEAQAQANCAQLNSILASEHNLALADRYTRSTRTRTLVG